ncbi:MAG: hypothetical protein ACI81T_000769 [Bacteroidia bacterium]|jgi:hypothetical protein
MQVDRLDKIKIDGIKAVFKRMGNSDTYYTKVVLASFIPIRMKKAQFKFVKKEGKMYFKQIDVKRQTGDYVAIKTDKIPIRTMASMKLLI